MQNLTIGLLQAIQHWEDKEKNLNHLEQLLDQLKPQVDLVALPEMFQTGFSMRPEMLAEEMDGPSVQWLKTQAKERDMAFVASLMIKEAEHYYNRMLFVTPDGNIARYDKRKLFGMAGEPQHYSPGDKATIVNFKGWNIFLQVCYDLRFPEIARNRITEGRYDYDLMLNVSNWPASRSLHWTSLLPARAIENQAYVAGVNRVGKGNGLSYSGDSRIISPLGEMLASSSGGEELISASLSYEALISLREKLPFLKDR